MNKTPEQQALEAIASFQGRGRAKLAERNAAKEQRERRDDLAKAAMQGALANGDADEYSYQSIADHAYQMADAMLEARDRRGK